MSNYQLITASKLRLKHFKIFTHITLTCFWCLMLAKSFWTGHIKAILFKANAAEEPELAVANRPRKQKKMLSDHRCLFCFDMQVASETKCCRRIRKRNCFPESLKPLSKNLRGLQSIKWYGHFGQRKVVLLAHVGVLVKCSMLTRIGTRSAADLFRIWLWCDIVNHCE